MKPIIAQIIYPLNYFNLFFHRKEKFNSKNFIKKLKKNLNVNDDLTILGRARTGIYLLVKHFLKSSKNNYVMIAPYTVPDVINMIIKAGGKPFFLDFEKQTTRICLKSLKRIIKKYKPAIIIVTHYATNDENLKIIFDICKKNSIKIIEDSAISFNGKVNKIKTNTLSDGSIFSFSCYKFLNYFFGGAIRCKNKLVYSEIQKEVAKWERMKLTDYIRPIISTLKHQFISLDFVFKNFFLPRLNKKKNIKKYTPYEFNKMGDDYFKRPSINCLMELNSKVNKINNHQNHRRKIAKIYCRYLKRLSVPKNISNHSIMQSSCINYLIYSHKSKYLINSLLKKNFDTGNFFYENCSKLKPINKLQGSSKNISDLIKNLILLPTHIRITEKYATKLSKEILKINDY
tara:strand:- start:302 stop:1504 length:1203 start_codon:yes stop_codon:yes gene_type:complete